MQGEEGPPSLEYIKAKDLFPQKELVKEDEGLQVSGAADPLVSTGLMWAEGWGLTGGHKGGTGRQVS
ncbi:Myotubularin-related protein 4 [Takifugu flavidus]|uniref:Myotubularin-related protein 4 n=1 Tax=Takifugu flavidus TaxID=433684 RepID=A0A5C6P5Q6_9TELE|nr:Myotubularin-related protein 4 [Takifugu flavidus]